MAGWQGQRGNRHQRGYGKAWDKIRAAILLRDEYLCQCTECQYLNRLRPATEVDHITPKSQGGTDDPDNLQAISRECHQRKTIAERDQVWGCDENGIPMDPGHHWQGRGGLDL